MTRNIQEKASSLMNLLEKVKQIDYGEKEACAAQVLEYLVQCESILRMALVIANPDTASVRVELKGYRVVTEEMADLQGDMSMVNNGEGGLAVVNSVDGALPMVGGAGVGNVLSDGVGMGSQGLLVSDSFADQMCHIGVISSGVEEMVTEPERKENREGNESVIPMDITTSSQDQIDDVSSQNAEEINSKIKKMDITFHKCQQCSKQFRLKKDLNRHAKTHDQKSGSKSKLKSNTKSKHSQSSSFNMFNDSDKSKKDQESTSDKSEESYGGICASPEEITTKTDKVVEADALTCEVCKIIASTRNALTKHYKKHHPEFKRYSCNFCEEAFLRQEELKIHKKSEHDEGRSQTDKSMDCYVCYKTLSSRNELHRHMRRVHPEMAEYKCSECQLILHGDEEIENHKAKCARTPRKTDGGTYICELCGKEFEKRYKLNSHMQKHILDATRPFVCSVCGKKFTRKSMLKIHEKRHSTDRPFACTVCNKTFAIEKDLIVHSRYHSDDKFQCEICKKVYNHKKTLWNHMLRHKGERPHVCEKCGKSFYTLTALNMHDRIHTGYRPSVCKVCGKAFRGDNYLRSHMLMHTGEKPHLCNVCGKYFSRQYNLRQHMQTHSEEKPFSCEHCGKGFYRKKKMAEHAARCLSERSDALNSGTEVITAMDGQYIYHLYSHTNPVLP